MGNWIANDDFVFTSSIDTVTSLSISALGISDLTGIEYFTALEQLFCDSNQLGTLDVSNNTALTILNCGGNQLTSLDVSNNTALTALRCYDNQLTTLDVSQNTALWKLDCWGTQLTSLDVSNNTALTYFWCDFNQLTSLDVSQSTALVFLSCGANQLTSLDVSNNTALDVAYCPSNNLTSLDLRNGNNTNFAVNNYTGNPNLTCISVDDAVWSTANWTVANGNIDPQHYFSNNCSATAIEELNTNKTLLKIVDALGRKAKGKNNELLFYIYDDNTVQKKLIVE